MKKLWIIITVFILIIGIGYPTTHALCAQDEDLVYIIPIEGEITPTMATFVKQKVDEAQRVNAKAIIIEISTLGGRVDAALNIKDSIQKSKVPIIVYISDRAVSAGALISIAAPRIIMAPGSHIGSAEPIPYSVKAVAAIRGEFEAIAEARGRDKAIAAAMVDKEIEIPGLSPAGSLLDMTANTAKEYGYVEEVLEGRQSLLSYLEFETYTIIENKPDILERIAQFLTLSQVASILLTIGILAIIIEIFTQGFGVAGVIGISALVLYFGSGLVAGYSQWWPIVVFVIGIALLVLEAFIPGFGVAGIGGLTAMLVGMVFAAPDPVRGIKNIGIASVLVIILAPVLYYYLKSTQVFKRFILMDTVTGEVDVGTKDDDFIGKRGVALTTLRPSGIVDIDGVRVDAISEGDFIAPGTHIKVIKSKGLTMIVARDNIKDS
ncbi:MAG TPA: NfeD family protein [Clostridia bacterium]|nr:NfeD family protein [Clostridia bacterium]